MANEKRLIDANALMDAFRSYMVERYDSEKCVSEENCKICDRPCLWHRMVSEAHTVDAVEVVRCKDCKHYEDCDHGSGKICYRWDEWIYPNEDNFCSLGERKDNG